MSVNKQRVQVSRYNESVLKCRCLVHSTCPRTTHDPPPVSEACSGRPRSNFARTRLSFTYIRAIFPCTIPPHSVANTCKYATLFNYATPREIFSRMRFFKRRIAIMFEEFPDNGVCWILWRLNVIRTHVLKRLKHPLCRIDWYGINMALMWRFRSALF